LAWIPESALVVSAHPDDLDFGCSGTVALWRRAGTRVAYVICTDGDKGGEDPHIPAEVLSDVRRREQRAAAGLVGVAEVYFLGFADGELENNLALRESLVELVRRFKPDVILCQDPANRAFDNAYLSHGDHRAAAEAAFDAVYPAAGSHRFFPRMSSLGLKPHKVREALFFGTHAPNFWVDITSVIEIKIQALLCHRSQVSHPDEVERFIRRRFSEAGEAVGFEYAEPFRRLLLPP
jgi:LmbE family N-acetylglucosaminyl deacetylase